MNNVNMQLEENNSAREGAWRHFLETKPGRAFASALAIASLASACSGTPESSTDSTAVTVNPISNELSSTTTEPSYSQTDSGGQEIIETDSAAGNSMDNIEGPDAESANWKWRIGSLSYSSYPGNFGEVLAGNVELIDESNPLSILEYHHLNVLGAVCTGDADRLANQYVDPEDRSAEGDIYALFVGEIEKWKSDIGQEDYVLTETQCSAYSYSFSDDTLRNTEWLNDGNKVQFDIEAYDKSTGYMVDNHYVFERQDDSWRLFSVGISK